jgi:hypothetical protein
MLKRNRGSESQGRPTETLRQASMLQFLIPGSENREPPSIEPLVNEQPDFDLESPGEATLDVIEPDAVDPTQLIARKRRKVCSLTR